MRMTKPRLIIFDYGGTLLNESDFSFREGEKAVFRHVIKNPRNLSSDEVSDFETAYYTSLKAVRDLGYEPHEYQMLRLKYELNEIELDISYEEAEEILWDHTQPLSEQSYMPGIRGFLAFLRESGIRTGVVSNLGWSQKSLIRRIERMFPEHQFDFILGSSAYGLRKPDKRLFELALVKAGLRSPEGVWFIGDTFEMDVLGSHGAGMFPVLFTGTVQNGPVRSEDVRQADFPYLTVSHYDELEKMIRGLV